MTELAGLAKVVESFAALGLDVPEWAKKVDRQRIALMEAANADPVSVMRQEVLDDSIDSDEDWGERIATACAALGAKDQARLLLMDLEPMFAKRVARWVHADQDALIGALRSKFDPAVKKAAKALETIGYAADLDGAVAVAGGKGADALLAYRDAYATLLAVRQARHALARAGLGERAEDVVWWTAGARTLDELQRQRELLQASHTFDVAAFLGAGYTLTVNGPVRCAEIDEEARAGTKAAEPPAATPEQIERHNTRTLAEDRELTGRPA